MVLRSQLFISISIQFNPVGTSTSVCFDLANAISMAAEAAQATAMTGPLSGVERVLFDVNKVHYCPTVQASMEASDVAAILGGQNVLVGKSRHCVILRTNQTDPRRQNKRYILKLYQRNPGVPFEQDVAFHEFRVGCVVNSWNVSDFMATTIGIVELNCEPASSQANGAVLRCRQFEASAAAATTSSHACIISEFVEGELLPVAFGRVSFGQVMRLMIHLFRRLETIPFTHYDLTVSNLILSPDRTSLKIIDFGRSHAQGLDLGAKGMYTECDRSFIMAGIQPGIADPYCDFMMCINSPVSGRDSPNRQMKAALDVHRVKFLALLKEINLATKRRATYFENKRDDDQLRFIYPMPESALQELGPLTDLLDERDLLPCFNDHAIHPLTLKQTVSRLQVMYGQLEDVKKSEPGHVAAWFSKWRQFAWRLFASHKKWVISEVHGVVDGVKMSRTQFVGWMTEVMERHAKESDKSEPIVISDDVMQR
jgi:hypothetical protein